jgi:uncharacterized UBP type Zn finger protein
MRPKRAQHGPQNETDYGPTRGPILHSHHPRPLLLKIEGMMVSGSIGSPEYVLVAVVRHIGPRITGGHYVVDRCVAGSWWRLDDSRCAATTEASALETMGDDTPYMMLYAQASPHNV